MGSQATKKEEKYIDIEDLLKESLSDKNVTGDKEDMVLEYLCQTISKTDSYDALQRKARDGDTYAYIQLASWHISHAKNIKDYCAAYHYALKASKHGYVESYYILGQLYLYGTGCIKNVHKAIKYLDIFVHTMSSKDLLNDSVLTDAYLKLATTEKKLGHYAKSCQYYTELQKIDPQYETEAGEMLSLLQNNRKEFTSFAFYIVIACLIVCGTVYFLGSYLLNEYSNYAGRYKIEPKVTIIEKETPAPQPVVVTKPTIEVQEPVTYTLVSESVFESLGFQTIPVRGISSTSEYVSSKGNYYGAKNLLDSSLGTSWQEGEEDGGIGQSIHFTFDTSVMVSAMCIYNGKQTSEEAFFENNRVASFTIFDDDLCVELTDDMQPQYIVFENPLLIDNLTFTIQSIFSGTKWNDTCITKIIFYE